MTRISIEGYEPKHLSWSTFDSYNSCGERQRLQKVLMLEQKPNWGSVGGTALHDCVETIEQHGPDLGPLEEWHQYFDTTGMYNDALDEAIAATLERSPSFGKADWYVSPNRGKPKDEAWWRTEGVKMVDRWLTWRREVASQWKPWVTPDGQVAIELECNFLLPGDIPVKAFIDSVWELPTGAIVVVDVKSGRLPETTGQLGLYRVALKTIYDIDVNYGFFWDGKKGTHGDPRDLTDWSADYMGELFEAAIRGHNAGVFMPKPQNGCARWCGVARFCRAVGGELAHTVPPLQASS